MRGCTTERTRAVLTRGRPPVIGLKQDGSAKDMSPSKLQVRVLQRSGVRRDCDPWGGAGLGMGVRVQTKGNRGGRRATPEIAEELPDPLPAPPAKTGERRR